jgi:hypothetical protein
VLYLNFPDGIPAILELADPRADVQEHACLDHPYRLREERGGEAGFGAGQDYCFQPGAAFALELFLASLVAA